jgi:hypothetical protein
MGLAFVPSVLHPKQILAHRLRGVKNVVLKRFSQASVTPGHYGLPFTLTDDDGVCAISGDDCLDSLLSRRRGQLRAPGQPQSAQTRSCCSVHLGDRVGRGSGAEVQGPFGCPLRFSVGAALGNLLRDPNWLLGSGFCRSRCWLGYHNRIGNRLRNIDGFRAGLMSPNHARPP